MHPRFFQFGHVVVPTYGVLIALGILLSLIVCFRAGRLLGLDLAKLWNLALLAIVVSIGGAKLLLAAMNWSRYGARGFAFSLSGSDGALLGGFALAILACWLYAHRAGMPLRRTADALAPALAIFTSVAAIGCLEAGCGYGTPTHLPWAVVFTGPTVIPGPPVGVPLHPTQLYAALLEFCFFVLLLWLLHRSRRDGEVMGTWLFLSGLARYLLSFLRGDGGGQPLLDGLFTITQLVGVLMVLGGGALWMRRGNSALGSRAARSEEHHAV